MSQSERDMETFHRQKREDIKRVLIADAKLQLELNRKVSSLARARARESPWQPISFSSPLSRFRRGGISKRRSIRVDVIAYAVCALCMRSTQVCVRFSSMTHPPPPRVTRVWSRLIRHITPRRRKFVSLTGL